MLLYFVIIFIFLLSLTSTVQASVVPEDLSPDPGIVRTSLLPVKADYRPDPHDRYELFRYDSDNMPSVGNGRIAHVIYTDSVYVQGFYAKDANDNYHRGRLPAEVSFRINFTGPDGAAIPRKEEVPRSYEMNFNDGYWQETIRGPDSLFIKKRVYAHQVYTSILMTDLVIRSAGAEKIQRVYELINLRGKDSENMPYESNPKVDRLTGLMYVRARPVGSNNILHVYYTNVFVRRKEIQPGQEKKDFFYMAIGENPALVRQDIREVQKMIETDPEAVFNKHVEAWKAIWNNASVEIETTDLHLQKVHKTSWYYLLSSLPPVRTYKNENQSEATRGEFWGLSPDGLAHGAAGDNFDGLVMWDQEMWMMPPLTLFYPEAAEHILSFRYHSWFTDNAPSRYFWQSVRGNGRQVLDAAPKNCRICRKLSEQATHVTAGVGFAIRQFVSATGTSGLVFLKNRGMKILEEIARHYIPKLELNQERVPMKDFYDLPNVMGPDIFHENQLNNAFTNVIVMMAVHYARYADCLLSNKNLFKDFIRQAVNMTERLYIPYDPDTDTNYEFEGYDKLPENRKKVSGADTILIGYPLPLNMSDKINEWFNATIRWHDLRLYEKHTDFSRVTPQTKAMYSIGFGEVPMTGMGFADIQFKELYEFFVRKPFMLWQNNSQRLAGASTRKTAINYLPGAGSFLQTIINGYVGIRIRIAQMDFLNPKLPGHVSRIKFNGMKYKDSEFDITVEDRKITILHRLCQGYSFRIYDNSTKKFSNLKVQKAFTLGRNSFSLIPTNPHPCYLPIDGMYWGYNQYINTSPSFHNSLIVTLSFVCVMTFRFCRPFKFMNDVVNMT